MPIDPAVVVTVAALAVLLIGERLGRRVISAPMKVVASSGFLALAVRVGLLEHRPGQLLFAGLVLSFVGDVALLSKEKRPFLVGLGAFLLAHVAYATAFAASALDPRTTLVASVPMTVVVGLVLRWLLPHVKGKMRGPVVAYALAIGVMVVLAIGVMGEGSARITNGAILFLVSDLFVARERFVSSGFVNRAVGLPLYYAGQVFLILGVSANA